MTFYSTYMFSQVRQSYETLYYTVQFDHRLYLPKTHLRSGIYRSEGKHVTETDGCMGEGGELTCLLRVSGRTNEREFGFRTIRP